MPSPADPDRRPLDRRFLRVWAGQTVSSIGSTLTGVAVAVHVFLETGNAVWLGLLSAVAASPYLVTGLLAGWVDRRSRRTTMLLSDCLAAVSTFLALALALFGELEVWHLVVVGFVGGLGTSVQESAASAAVVSLVPPDQVDRANGLRQLGPALGIVIGPAAATPLLVFGGLEAVLLVDAATFAIGILAVFLTPFDDPPRSDEHADDGTLRAAWRWLGDSGSGLRRLMAVSASINFVFAWFNIALIALATVVIGPARAGLVLAAGGVAMVAGSVFTANRGLPADRLKPLTIGLLAAGAGCIVAASRPLGIVIAVGVVIALFSIPMVNASASTIYNERVPPQMQGRVNALRAALGQSLQPLGAIAAGVAVSTVAAPAMRDGFVADTAGALIGRGEDRGAALVLGAVGIVLAAMGMLVRSFRLPPPPTSTHASDDEHPTEPTDDEDSHPCAASPARSL